MTAAFAIGMLCFLGILLYRGVPVFAALGLVAAVFAAIGVSVGMFNYHFLKVVSLRIDGIVSNQVLLAVPFFVLMGMLLQNSGLAERLLVSSGEALGRIPGGLAMSVVVVGTLLAAASGVVAASVISMGLISLPTMLRAGYPASTAAGVVAASGTLGQIIPPSIVLILLADQGGISVGQVFHAALIPGFALSASYLVYLGFLLSRRKYRQAVVVDFTSSAPLLDLAKNIIPSILLILMVLGSILAGLATPSEAGAVGALGALVLGATLGELDVQKIKKATAETTWITSMVILLLIGSSFFVAVFRGSGGHHLFESLFLGIPGGQLGFLIAMSLLIFLLGFVLDFFEIVFIVFPLVLPVAHVLGIDIAFLCIVVALNLQTSFLTPPFGFSLFYLKSVSPPEVTTQLIYRGIIPFVIIQIVVMSGYIAFQLLSS